MSGQRIPAISSWELSSAAIAIMVNLHITGSARRGWLAVVFRHAAQTYLGLSAVLFVARLVMGMG